MNELNGVELDECVSNCFDLAIDLRYTREQRDSFLAHGVELRRRKKKLVSQNFAPQIQRVAEVNETIKKANAELKKSFDDISNYVTTIDNIAVLVKQLSDLAAIIGVVI
jgi:ribulose 1,5-bisphosphate carboxylase large subunit-like protein